MSGISELGLDLKELEVDFGSQTFTWEGVEYLCTPSPIAEAVEILVGGNPVTITASLMVRDSLFTTPPAFGAKITYREAEYIVVQATSGHGVFTKLLLASPER